MSTPVVEFLSRDAYIESCLRQDLPDLVGGLVVANLVTDPQAYPLNLERFSIVPLAATYPTNLRANEFWLAPEGITVYHDRLDGERTHLDTPYGMGLVGDGVLLGIAGLNARDGRLHVEQLQGALRLKRHRELNSLVNNGPEWSETLVRAAGAIAGAMGLSEFSLHSLRQDAYEGYEPDPDSPLYKHYDGLAQQMHFQWDPEGKVWVMQLSELGQSPAVPAAA